MRVSGLVAPAVIAALLAGSLVATSHPGELLPRLAVLGVGFAVALRPAPSRRPSASGSPLRAGRAAGIARPAA